MGQIVNAQLMANLAVEFNVGADILSKGNRTIESKLGASNMSGDTVNVTIMDSGKVFQNSLDLAGLRGTMGVKRASVPVRVTPLGIAAEASEGELALAIERPDIMAKRVANLQDEVNKKAYRGILASTQPYAFDPTGMTGEQIDRAIRRTCFRGEAHTQTSKLGGNIFGLAHPQTWNEVVPSLHANFGANPKVGSDLYKNELGDFMGYRFTKGVDTMRVTAQDIAAVVTSISVGLNGELNITISGIGTGTEDGEIFPMPLYLTDNTAAADGVKHKVECVDALGKPTGVQKAIYFKWKVGQRSGLWLDSRPEPEPERPLGTRLPAVPRRPPQERTLRRIRGICRLRYYRSRPSRLHPARLRLVHPAGMEPHSGCYAKPGHRWCPDVHDLQRPD